MTSLRFGGLYVAEPHTIRSPIRMEGWIRLVANRSFFVVDWRRFPPLLARTGKTNHSHYDENESARAKNAAAGQPDQRSKHCCGDTPGELRRLRRGVGFGNDPEGLNHSPDRAQHAQQKRNTRQDH